MFCIKRSRKKKLCRLTDFQLAKFSHLRYSPRSLFDSGGPSFDRHSRSWRFIVQEHLIELSVGESIQVGGYVVTLIGVHGDQLAIEIVDGGQYEGNELCDEQHAFEVI